MQNQPPAASIQHPYSGHRPPSGAADLPPAALPLPEHVAQLRSYLTLVAKIRREPAEGRLVYLDRREIYPVKLAGANS